MSSKKEKSHRGYAISSFINIPKKEKEMLGAKIKKLRKAQNLTEVELAQKLGIKQPSLNRWENGKKNPPLKMLKKLSRIFNVSIDTLVFDEKDIEHLSSQEKNIISQIKQFEHLDDKGKEAVLNMINLLASKQEQGKN